MPRENLRDLIVGAAAAVATPFDDNYEVDLGKMYDLTQWWVANGLVKGNGIIKVAAAAGEGPMLDDPEWAALLRTTVQAADGKAAIMCGLHYKDTKRTTGQEGLVAQLSLAHLQLLDAGAWKGPQWRETRIPTIEQVLSTVPPGRTLVIEIKCPIGVLPELERVLDASGKRDQVMLIAFDYETIAEAKRRMPELRSCWLYGFSGTEAARYKIAGPESLLERVGEAGLDGLDVKHDGPWVEDLSRSLAALGKALYVYTVNDPGKARWLRDIGVTGITTDRPGFLREALAGE